MAKLLHGHRVRNELANRLCRGVITPDEYERGLEEEAAERALANIRAREARRERMDRVRGFAARDCEHRAFICEGECSQDAMEHRVEAYESAVRFARAVGVTIL